MIDYRNAAVGVVRLERGKGGSTGWPSMIAYVDVVKGRITELNKKIFAANQGRVLSDDYAPPTRLRVLFRQDPFSGQWRHVTQDIYANGNFMSASVPSALQSD
jgi:hypothetical protein